MDGLYRPFAGIAYRVIPERPPGEPQNDPLDSSFSALSDDNRWNKRGQPTLYLAGDVGVVAGEWARHVTTVALPQDVERKAKPRRIWEIDLRVDRTIDLRDPAVWDVLSLLDAPSCFASISFCQNIATNLRQTTQTQAVLAPSMAFTDQLDRWS